MYREKYNIGDFNRQVIFENWDYTRDIGAGNMKLLLNSFMRFAKIDPRFGGDYVADAQQQWSYTAPVVVRYNPDIRSNSTFVYNNARYKITELSINEEAKHRFMNIRASFMYGPLVDGSIVACGCNVYLYEYDGIGGETQWNDTDMINKTIVGAFKDGVQYKIIFSGTPNPLFKQVLYEPLLGQFTWSQAYSPDEQTTIQYI